MNKCTKNALITGAGSGIGAEIAKELAPKPIDLINDLLFL